MIHNYIRLYDLENALKAMDWSNRAEDLGVSTADLSVFLSTLSFPDDAIGAPDMDDPIHRAAMLYGICIGAYAGLHKGEDKFPA